LLFDHAVKSLPFGFPPCIQEKIGSIYDKNFTSLRLILQEDLELIRIETVHLRCQLLIGSEMAEDVKITAANLFMDLTSKFPQGRIKLRLFMNDNRSELFLS